MPFQPHGHLPRPPKTDDTGHLPVHWADDGGCGGGRGGQVCCQHWEGGVVEFTTGDMPSSPAPWQGGRVEGGGLAPAQQTPPPPPRPLRTLHEGHRMFYMEACSPAVVHGSLHGRLLCWSGAPVVGHLIAGAWASRHKVGSVGEQVSWLALRLVSRRFSSQSC